MKKRIIIGLSLVGIAVAVVFGLIWSGPSENTGREQIYHARIADPKQYHDGIFTDSFPIKKGVYEFRFVLNGDSPEMLSVSLKGSSFSFAQDYKLEGTQHGDFGKYYTWKYLGQDKIEVSEDQQLQITINPHGNVQGPFSIYLIK